jgi:ankyrin repeat protein
MLFRKADKLFSAVSSGDYTKTAAIIKKIKNVDCRDRRDNTPLIIASAGGDINIVRELIENGADVNALNSDNESSILAAAKNGQLEILSYLIDHKADINVKDKVEYSVLHAAAGFGHLAAVEILLPLCREKDSPDIFGNTPLLYAAMYGHNNIIEFLLDNGSDADARNVNGNTPLFEAASGGHANSAKILLKYGARPDIANNSGISAHVIAYNNEHYSLSSYISQENDKKIKDKPSENVLQPGNIKTSDWLDSNTGRHAGYTETRQTIVGEFDSTREGSRNFSGILKKRDNDFYIYAENLDTEIVIDSYPRQCLEKAESLTWQDYRTYGIFLEKTISFTD